MPVRLSLRRPPTSPPSRRGRGTGHADDGVGSMIACATVRKRAIQTHYDLATPFYRLLWGVHIHHGLWEADESPEAAQRRLIDRLAHAAGLRGGERVLDVG